VDGLRAGLDGAVAKDGFVVNEGAVANDGELFKDNVWDVLGEVGPETGPLLKSQWCCKIQGEDDMWWFLLRYV
jgi:hypothetical protein